VTQASEECKAVLPRVVPCKDATDESFEMVKRFNPWVDCTIEPLNCRPALRFGRGSVPL
jgi:hypothetical protein